MTEPRPDPKSIGTYTRAENPDFREHGGFPFVARFRFVDAHRGDVVRWVGEGGARILERLVASCIEHRENPEVLERSEEEAALRELARAAAAFARTWSGLPAVLQVRMLLARKGAATTPFAVVDEATAIGVSALAAARSIAERSKGRKGDYRAKWLTREFDAALVASIGRHAPQNEDSAPLRALQLALWAIGSSSNPKRLVAGLRRANRTE